ncbi:MAG: carbamoyltransferase HypF [Candidatus Thermoplasmatota archaeon]|nr:carbamoyltransferase HypF [Candidatus Thermoplasmatota archaeon]
MRAKIIVNGVVQGVGFRPFIYRIAFSNKLKGYVLNLGDAGVEIVVEGSKERIENFINDIERKKPPLANIDSMDVKWGKEEVFKTFEIRKSSEDVKNGTASIIPPDVGICDECIEEMNDRNNRRYNYFFTTCTNCGPRYTVIKKLPYDRPNTTMDEFPMCNDCRAEYTDVADRRYHAQTIACETCGPQVYLLDGMGNNLKSGREAIWKAALLLMNKKIIAVKGNGGFHIACSAFYPDAIKKLREILGRENKPFAIMANGIDMVKNIAFIDDKEKEMLTSYIKPIVVLEKKKKMEMVAPGLHNVGIMLPYTGLHVMLFQKCPHPLIMTSANVPGEPIVYKNKEAIKKFGGRVDYFLLYDRKIAHRCDDTVVRFVDGKPVLLRRSRGYVPAPVKLSFNTKDVLALGAELNVTSCILANGRAFLSPYIGNTTKHDTIQFLEEETRHLLKLTNARPEAVAHDTHPQFSTTKMAMEFGDEYSAPVIGVQHHHAHIAGLMGEFGVNETVGIAIDGIGYGEDGNIWGGEVLHCSFSDYERVGHLEEQYMIGGDLATKYPLRMVASILPSGSELDDFLYTREKSFPYGKKEIEILLKQVKKKEGIKTTSCGRILDAVAALLDIRNVRTYEGEPAMRLESYATGGKSEAINPKIEWGDVPVLNTSYMLNKIWDGRKKNTKNLAFSAEEYLAKGLAEIAVEYAIREHIATVGVAGGCAYNEHMVKVIRKEVESRDIKFLRNEKLPAGDGGISFGQALVANAKIR